MKRVLTFATATFMSSQPQRPSGQPPTGAPTPSAAPTNTPKPAVQASAGGGPALSSAAIPRTTASPNPKAPAATRQAPPGAAPSMKPGPSPNPGAARMPATGGGAAKPVGPGGAAPVVRSSSSSGSIGMGGAALRPGQPSAGGSMQPGPGRPSTGVPPQKLQAKPAMAVRPVGAPGKPAPAAAGVGPRPAAGGGPAPAGGSTTVLLNRQPSATGAAPGPRPSVGVGRPPNAASAAAAGPGGMPNPVGRPPGSGGSAAASDPAAGAAAAGAGKGEKLRAPVPKSTTRATIPKAQDRAPGGTPEGGQFAKPPAAPGTAAQAVPEGTDGGHLKISRTSMTGIKRKRPEAESPPALLRVSMPPVLRTLLCRDRAQVGQRRVQRLPRASGRPSLAGILGEYVQSMHGMPTIRERDRHIVAYFAHGLKLMFNAAVDKCLLYDIEQPQFRVEVPPPPPLLHAPPLQHLPPFARLFWPHYLSPRRGQNTPTQRGGGGVQRHKKNRPQISGPFTSVNFGFPPEEQLSDM